MRVIWIKWLQLPLTSTSSLLTVVRDQKHLIVGECSCNHNVVSNSCPNFLKQFFFLLSPRPGDSLADQACEAAMSRVSVKYMAPEKDEYSQDRSQVPEGLHLEVLYGNKLG